MAGVKNRSGRKKHDLNYEDTQKLIFEAAPIAAKYIKDVLDGKVRKFSQIRADLAKFTVEQTLGKARQKLELPAGSTGITIESLVILAQEASQPVIESQEPDQVIDGEVVTHVEHMLPEKITSVEQVLPESTDNK